MAQTKTPTINNFSLPLKVCKLLLKMISPMGKMNGVFPSRS